MRTIVLKLFCWLCVALTTNILAYQNTNTNSKTAYIESEWRHKLNTKGYSNNRYAALLMGSSSTTYKPPWNTKPENTKHTRHSSYAYVNSNSNNNNHNAVRLRHSRYPNLDGVITRLDKMHTTTKMPATTSPPFNAHHRYHNSKMLDKLFYENYDDNEDPDYEDEDLDDDAADVDNDNLPDYDNWGNEEDKDNTNNEADDEDDDVFEEEEDDDEEGGWQAEEATEAAPSSLTDYKWQHYGTRTRVEESRRNQIYPQQSEQYAAVNAAIQHTLRMNKESRCRDPLPRVLSIQNEHPDPGKTYLPHCTVLHRCAEDTGCCPNHAEKCAMKSQKLVHLYFYTTTVGVPGTIVEKLAFYNHTECACLDKTLEPSALDDSVPKVTRPYRSNLSVRAADSSLFATPQTIRRCKCPEEYTPKLHRGTYCSCDCSDGNVDCGMIKRGNEFFSLKDRLCILNGECGYPTCEYGAYMRNTGRCPRKHEKLEAFANVSANLN